MHPTPRPQDAAGAGRARLLPECQEWTACRCHRSPCLSPRSACHPSSRRSFRGKPGFTRRRSFLASSATWRQLGGVPLPAVHAEPHACVPLATLSRVVPTTPRASFSQRSPELSSPTEPPGSPCGDRVRGPDTASAQGAAGGAHPPSSSPVAARNVRPSPPATSQKRARTELCASETLTRTSAASP